VPFARAAREQLKNSSIAKHGAPNLAFLSMVPPP
jgi:hypothetical protein